MKELNIGFNSYAELAQHFNTSLEEFLDNRKVYFKKLQEYYNFLDDFRNSRVQVLDVSYETGVLREGFMNNQELAEWFLITKNTIRRRRTKYLEKLKDYCDFEDCNGGVNILEVFKPYYVKNKNLEIVQQEFEKVWSDTNIDSCKRVSSEIYSKRRDEFTVAESTVYSQTRQMRNELYGKPGRNSYDYGYGIKGRCCYVWCKANEEGKLIPLTEEEDQIRKDLFREMFEPAMNEAETEELMDAAAFGGMDEVTKKYFNFFEYLASYYEKTGVSLRRGTFVEKNAF